MTSDRVSRVRAVTESRELRVVYGGRRRRRPVLEQAVLALFIGAGAALLVAAWGFGLYVLLVAMA
jgi:hypothetical protein